MKSSLGKIFFGLAILLSSVIANAGPIDEVWFTQDSPTPQLIQRWRNSPSTTRLRAFLKDPSAQDLLEFEFAHREGRLELVLGRFPDPSTLPALERLSQIRPLWLAFTEGGFPVVPEIERLNRLQIRKLIIVFIGLPSEAPARNLALLKAPVQLTYATREYPKYMDRNLWEAIPKSTPLLISTDYWPFYTAMDFLNILKLPVSLRVAESFIPEESWPYLLNIKGLQGVELESDWDGPSDFNWSRLGTQPVRWTRRYTPPSLEALNRFASSLQVGKRELLLDLVESMTQEEVRYLKESELPVTWIRSTDLQPPHSAAASDLHSHLLQVIRGL